MLTMAPLPRSTMCRPTDREHQNTPLRLMPMSRNHSSGLISRTGLLMQMPAFLTRMSTRPSSAMTAAVMASTSTGSATFTRTATDRRPMLLTSAAASVAVARFKSATAMSAPAAARVRTTSRPMPCPPPVTSATLPATLNGFCCSAISLPFLFWSPAERIPTLTADLCGEGLGPAPAQDVTAQMDLEAEGVEHGGFRSQRAIGIFTAGGVGHLDMVGTVPGHELVASDAVHYRVQTRPFVGSRTGSPLGLFCWERDGRGAADVGVEPSVHHEHSTPHHLARLAGALERPAAEGEVHGGLALADRARIAVFEVRGGHRARDLEHPHEVVAVPVAPTHVVQSGRGIEAQRRPHSVGDDGIDGRAFVDLVEVGHGLAGPQLTAGDGIENGRSRGIVEQAFREVRSRYHVLEALLVLDADGVAAEGLGHPDRGDVHLQLRRDLPFGELGGFVGAELELHAAQEQPVERGHRLRVLDLEHGRIQGRLAQALLEEAARVEQLVVEEGVVHAHAAFVEDAQDRRRLHEVGGKLATEPGIRHRQLRRIEVANVGSVVDDRARPDPLADPVPRELVLEIHAPDRAIRDLRLGHRRREIEQPH